MITNKISKRNFNQFINKMIYGKRRSASAHDNIDINSNSTINVVQKEYQKFHQIVDTYIEDFLDKHKSSIV
jgi:Lhr-like helicase